MSKLFPETLTRLQYLLRVFIVIDLFLIVLPGLFLIAAWFQQAGVHSQIPLMAAAVLAILFGIFLIIFRIQMDIARLRSIAWSPWCVLLHLVPIANLVLVLFLFFGPPVNDASDDSERGVTARKVLVWLVAVLVVPAVMGGLIAAIAIPNFQKARAQHQKWTFPSLSTFAKTGAGAPGTSSSSSSSSAAAGGSGKTGAPAAGQSPAAAQPANTATPAGPTTPSAAAVAAASSFHLDSIFYQSQYPMRSSAVVNGNTVMVDDAVGTWKVSEIASNSITLVNKDGEPLVLWRK